MKIDTNTKDNTQNAFTLIELLVAMSIMAILATIVMTNFRVGQKLRSVQLGTDVIISALRSAQNYAQNGSNPTINFTLKTGTPCSTPGPLSDVYVYFGAINTYSSSTSISVGGSDSCPAEYLQTFKLPDGTQLRASTGLNIDGTNMNTVKLRFSAPFAQLGYIDSSNQFKTFTSLLIKIESKDGTVYKTIDVSGITGRIDVF
jgi:prepilin-type N-terminal cleavage/methylation domain-containing protein